MNTGGVVIVSLLNRNSNRREDRDTVPGAKRWSKFVGRMGCGVQRSKISRRDAEIAERKQEGVRSEN